ncbi:MAG: hypothetical protein IH995_01595 [Proteobacteria bacterium]|nr:hypothetical protein [Pseudomonadota bacterium]
MTKKKKKPILEINTKEKKQTSNKKKVSQKDIYQASELLKNRILIFKNIEKTFSFLPNIQKDIERIFKPAADLQSAIEAIKVPIFPTNQFKSAIDELVKSQKQWAHDFQIIFPEPWKDLVASFPEVGKRSKILEETGWLPHYSTPFKLIDEAEENLTDLKASIDKYYTTNWKEIRKEIERKIKNYKIDAEAQSTFLEALDCHENGFYRSTVRLLFPEIERVCSIELYDGETKGIASLSGLREIAGKLIPADLELKGYFGLILFRRLTEHLYQGIQNDDDLARFAQDPVPNRHAAMHGFIIYSTMQNSLNTIFMADYIFQIITSVKKRKKH